MNAFTDSSTRKAVVVLGVEVKSGATGGLDAEYQVGVWGMKTRNRMRLLRIGVADSRGEYALAYLFVHMYGASMSRIGGEIVLLLMDRCVLARLIVFMAR